MVGVTRIELVTPAMSMQCSPAELYAHSCGAYTIKAMRRQPNLLAGIA